MLHEMGPCMTPKLPDLLREQDGPRPLWLRSLYLAGAAVCTVAGIVGWLIPAVTGIPFYVVALVLLGLASDRMRRWINRLERRLPEKARWRLRRGLAKLPGSWVRRLIHLPDEAA